MNQSTLSRQVIALEAELGVSLFEKVGRGLSITPSGLELIEHVRTMASAANKLSLTATGQSEELEGTVVISATEASAAYVLPAMLKKLRREEPGIHVDLLATNSLSDLRTREADIAIRGVQPTHADLVARKVGETEACLFISKKYLAELGEPNTIDELLKADFVGFEDNTSYINGLNDIGLPITSQHFAFTSQSHIAHWELVKQGAGIGVMLKKVGDDEPLVERVFEFVPSFPVQIWLVSHRELKTSRRIRKVYDFLHKEIQHYFNE